MTALRVAARSAVARSAVARSLAVVVAVVAGAVILAARQRGVDVLDSMWAEDGKVYVAQAMGPDPAGALLRPYAGYLHLVSRAVAAVAAAGPPEAAAAVMSGSAALIVGAIAAFVFMASATLVRSLPLRAALAAAILFVPVARIESLANMANVHFYLIVAAAWALAWVPRHRAGRIVSGLLVVAAALGDPLIIVLAPLALWRWRTKSSAQDRLPVIVGAVALAIQVVGVMLGGVDTTTGHATDPDPWAIALLYPVRVVIGLFGLQVTWATWTAIAGSTFLVGGILLLAGAVVVATRVSRPDRWAPALLVLASVSYFAIVMWVRWDDGFAPTASTGFLRDGVRYLLVPVLLLFGAVIVVVDRVRLRVSAAARTVFVAGCLALLMGGWSVDVFGPNARTGGPSWATSIAEARVTCTNEPTADVTVPIAPTDWTMTMPCSAIIGRGTAGAP